MDKQMYKQLVADLMRREAKLKDKVEELELKLDQQTQDFHFDMRNKQMEVVQLTMENANLKDMVLDNGGDYTETDGYEVGSPSDYEEDKQLNIFESPDGGKTIYQRNAGSDEKEQIKG
tara:strand:+ start:201 stop:554 length:354 start_codon:yes stop_codon:yes gene_type:complete